MATNQSLFERAQITTPGGVNSPVRAFRSVGGTPRFISKAKGAYIWDVEGKQYIDCIGSWGPMILGHAHPEVVKAVQVAAENSFSYGAPTEAEILMAEKITQLVPSIEQVRLVSSGTEATMSALRLARGFTGRDLIVKFEGCYHGHADSLLVKAGSGLLTFAEESEDIDLSKNAPSSGGVPQDVIKHTLVLPFNDLAALEHAFAQFGPEIAALIVEPIAGNMNLVQMTPEFIAAMRSLTTQHGALLIYDEVMTGFRVALGGAQSLHGITPDLTCLGKVMGGGMPMAAFGGRRDIMQKLAPIGNVYQAGTLSGNPLAVAAGLTTLNLVSREGFYTELSNNISKLLKGLEQLAKEAGHDFSTDHVGGMFGIYFAKEKPQSLEDITKSDMEKFKRFFHAMLDEGVYLAPSAYEAGFLSIEHNDSVIEKMLVAAKVAFSKI
ncbi:glutamate-1-semialdehyde 2,1-aminomutase [Polynucleobacter kasalickyi]|uniref:Glutamate-1-semialdehyde 2,1-aminomutase n=1 Tax=Polynucleobacter kasalickyi TaxID=1938817 RepID=A0A1W2A7Q9_9BURK|nr:glutamate-1-semialdehyde 2,1-aminomutase [Polynucleobacter kasalickyi]SMC56704.1 glutamate-1-semialdehyde 2,1-aminomutase [Polynucleobacter kasalickyi]